MESDTLSTFFDRICLSGRLFYFGRVQGTLDLEKPPGAAFLHIVTSGGIDLARRGFPNIRVREPSLLLCPYECRYKLHAEGEGIDIVSASFDFGVSMGNAFPLGTTETLIFPFRRIKNIMPTVDLLLDEFGGSNPGRSKALGVLFEYLFILLIRTAVEGKTIEGGILQALQDSRLGAALTAIHANPERDWSLTSLADTANMSRSGFSELFTRLVGVPPITYLASWRIKLAQDLMKQGVRIKIVASRVGYGSQAAFTRAFTNDVGMPPREWLIKHSKRTASLPPA